MLVYAAVHCPYADVNVVRFHVLHAELFAWLCTHQHEQGISLRQHVYLNSGVLR